jgi:hypothetical protein
MPFMNSGRVSALRMKLAAEYFSLYAVLDHACCQSRAETIGLQVTRWYGLWISEATR